MPLKKVIALCGSTRSDSINLRIIEAISILAQDFFEIEIYPDLSKLPHFNPDNDFEFPSAEIAEFRNTLNAHQGILICTPEYAMGVPGTLKNAIDWTVSSMEFSKKPVALITASTLGEKCHQSLLATLEIIESKMLPETQLLISYVKTKFNKEGEFTDLTTLNAVNSLIQSLLKLMDDSEIELA